MRQRTFSDENRIDELGFGLDQIRSHGLCAIEVGYETELILDSFEQRKVCLVQRFCAKITHFTCSRMRAMILSATGRKASSGRSKHSLSVMIFKVLHEES